MTERRRVLLLALLTVLLWWPVVTFELLGEDHLLLGLAKQLTEGPDASIAGFWADSWFGEATALPSPTYYRPWPKLLIAAERWIGGGPTKARDIALHASNLIGYAGGVVFLYLLLRRIGVPPLARWIAAAAFAVHPVHGEPVAWIAARTDIWVGFWSLLAMVLALTVRERRGSRRLMTARWIALPVAAFLAGSSKESGAMLPLLIAIVWWTAARVRQQPVEWRRLAKLLAVVTVPLAAVYVMRGLTIGHATYPVNIAPFGPLHYTFWERTQTALFACRLYAWNTLFPFSLTFEYELRNALVPAFEHLPLGGWGGIVAILGWAGFAALGGWWLRARGAGWRIAGTGVALFFIAFVPISHVLIPFGVPIADRFFYVPSVFLAVMLAGLLTHARRPAVAAAAAFTLLWAGIAIWDMQRFRDDRALWGAALRVDPGNFVANASLAEMDYNDGHWLDALNHARIAIRRNAPRIQMVHIAADSMERLGIQYTPEVHEEYELYREMLRSWRPPGGGGQ